MLVDITMIWVLIKLNAPAWCLWFVGITIFAKIIVMMVKMYQAGNKAS